MMYMHNRRALIATSAAISLFGAHGAAFSQTPAEAAVTDAGIADAQLGEIIVTARRTAENVQRVPIAVTAISADAFQNIGSVSPTDITRLVPGIRVTPTISERSKLVYSIRGQGVTSGALFPAVLPYFAEVPITSELSRGHLFDLENVQVLRGPQGVRFGRVTDGGAVLIQPKRPTNRLEGYVEVKLGNYSLRGGQGAINIPIVDDKVLLRAAFEIVRQRGFTKNVPTGKWLDDTNYQTGRVSLTIRPTEWLTNETVAEYYDSDENGPSNAIFLANPAVFAPRATRTPAQNAAAAQTLATLNAAIAQQQAYGPRRVFNGSAIYGADDFGIKSKIQQTLISNITTIDLSDDIRIRNIFGYTKYVKQNGYDFDGSPVPYIDVMSYFRPRDRQRQLSNEVQLQGKSFEILNWVVGYYRDDQRPGKDYEGGSCGSFTGVNSGSTPCFPQVFYANARSSAFYGQAEVDLRSLVPGLKVSGGIRRTTDKNTTIARTLVTETAATAFDRDRPFYGCEPGVSVPTCNLFSGTFKATTWEFGGSYEVSRNIFTYVTYRKGYRPGGFNQNRTATNLDASFQPEYDKSLELGVKTSGRLGDIPFRFNVAAFRDRYTDIQKRRSYFDGTRSVTDVSNVAAAKIKGVEIEGTVQPFRGLSIGGNLAYISAKFDRNAADIPTLYNPVNGACNAAAPDNFGFCPYNAFALTPKWQWSLNASYAFDLPDDAGKISIGGDLYHQAPTAGVDSSELNPDSFIPAYTIANANIRWSNVWGRPIDLSIFVTNLTDKTYLSSISSLSHRAASGFASYMYAPPRMVGGSIRYRFGAQ